MARILIIEHDPDVRNLLALQLQHLGHDPVGGGEAGEVGMESIDALVVEPTVPAAHAFTALVREQRPELPVIVLSVEPPTPRTRALAPAAHLLKPVRLERLGGVIDAALRA